MARTIYVFVLAPGAGSCSCTCLRLLLVTEIKSLSVDKKAVKSVSRIYIPRSPFRTTTKPGMRANSSAFARTSHEAFCMLVSGWEPLKTCISWPEPIWSSSTSKGVGLFSLIQSFPRFWCLIPGLLQGLSCTKRSAGHRMPTSCLCSWAVSMLIFGAPRRLLNHEWYFKRILVTDNSDCDNGTIDRDGSSIYT